MTAPRFRRRPVEAEAVLRMASPKCQIDPSAFRRVLLCEVSLSRKLSSLRSIAVLKTSTNPAVVMWSDMAVRKRVRIIGRVVRLDFAGQHIRL